MTEIIHLGGNQLGDRVLEHLRELHGDVPTVATLDALDRASGGGVDWFVSAGFQHVVPPELLDRAARSCNVHPSYLPWGRGKHPNVWVIVDGEPAGVTIHEMIPGLDAGPILAQRRVEVSFADDARALHQRLEDAAVDLFAQNWTRIVGGEIVAVAQEGKGSYHRGAEFFDLLQLDLDAEVTWRRALDLLRAATFPPHENLVIEADGRRYQVELTVREVW